MNDSNNNNSMPDGEPVPGLSKPALFLHASGAAEAGESWVSGLKALGLDLVSHRDLKGCQHTSNTVRDLPALATEFVSQRPGQPLILLRAPLLPEPSQLESLATLLSVQPDKAWTVLSNTEAEFNPFAGLNGPEPDNLAAHHTQLVHLLGRRVLHPIEGLPTHCLAIGAKALVRLAKGHRPPVRLADWIYLHDPDRDPWLTAPLDPHEALRPRAWGGLSERLHDWLDETILPDIAPDARPVTLHITHSWGGGVAQWVRSFIEADENGRNLQLCSEGPQTGQGAGQKLALYGANQLDSALDQWWLQPPIDAVADQNAQYREILKEVCRRYGVSRILVSSLVGHCLDALRTGLPTVQILHDHFPAWPLLSAHPENHSGDLAAALANPGVRQEFPGIPLETWEDINRQQVEAIREHSVRLAAPSHSVVDIQSGLGAGWKEQQVQVIPHGFPPMENTGPITPIDRDDGRLQIVIPGRVQAGKGASLLQDILPELTRVAQVWLLGTGRGGHEFFGKSGVHVVLEYQRDDLPGLMKHIGPHMACLLSLVPETFSYTLSEMNALGVPVLATRKGSFVERIIEGQNGWLAEPTPQAILEVLKARAENPESLASARQWLAGHQPASTADMVAEYNRLCPPVDHQPLPSPAEGQTLEEAQDSSLKGELLQSRLEAQSAATEQARLKAVVKERTEWAKTASRDLKKEIQTREKWVASLEEDIRQGQDQLQVALARIDQAERDLQELQNQYAQLEDQHERLDEEHQRVLNSSSWKITLPLRVSRRVWQKFIQARAWNPMRWPMLLSHVIRDLSTVGLSGTLYRMQSFDYGAEPEESPAALVEIPTDISLPESVPDAADPRVSIIIPVYNQLAFTASCLRSLVKAQCQVPFEVIVVDDESTDLSPERLPEVNGLHYLRNPKNLGFIGSCNRGAEMARGEFVVFLNNDTEVTDGWLDALADTFEARPDAGMVGSRLLYPDGQLQECGGLVFSDGSGWNYGRGDDPGKPEYRNLRETDYCSGACIMLSSELFRDLGGFDAHYAPAYYEDTDLAFKVRDHGLKVYVQPASTVIHHEGVTSGTDLASGTKKYQVTNREKFRERWAEALRRQPNRIENPHDMGAVRRARDHRLNGRVLVIDAYTPEPDQDSGSVRLTQMMNCLQDMGWGVSFLADNKAFAGHYTRDLQSAGVQAWYSPWVESLHAYLDEYGEAFDVVFISRHYVAINWISLLRKYCPNARFVFDTVDLHYLREQRQAELEDSLPLQRAARQTRRSELSVIEAADATLVVSPTEVNVLAEDAPGELVHVLSNIHQVPGCGAGFEERSDLFFVGGYQHPPNIDAATWFVNDIWPLIHQELPDARFHLVGSKAPDSIRALDGNGVRFHGFVESLDPFLDGCRLAVAPLRYGAGVKGKVNHSMAHGQPVVATPMAVEGMFAEHEHDVLVAVDAESFAREVVRLYQDQDLWDRLSKGSVDNVQEHFSTDAARRSLEALFDRLGIG